MKTTELVLLAASLVSAAPRALAQDDSDEARAGGAVQDEAISRSDSRSDFENLDARVIAIDGRTVTLDRGRASGVETGDLVRLLPLGSPVLEAVVRRVDEKRAEVELVEPEPAVELGTRAEVLLPSERLEQRATREQEVAPPPEHPPWTHPLDEWSDDLPLLAPAKSPKADERPAELHGRAYTRLDYTDDRQGAGREYLRSLTGLDLDWTNPFGQGGRIRFDSQFSYRDARLGEDGGSDSLARVRRLSYAVGGIPGRPHRFEVGRFLSSEFPELGLVDGVEYVHRPAYGHRFGASLGFLPEPFDELHTGEDLSAAAFYRFVSDAEERFALGAAYQKTWHEGEADRDLVLGTADWRVTDRTTFRGAAWVDLYGSGERVKSDGPELTELHLRLDHRFQAPAGLGVFASRVRWPDLLRDELPPTTASGVAENEVTRAGIDAWGQATRHLRLGARVDGWEDQVSSGHGAELRFGLRDLLYDHGSVDLSVFATQGRFSDGLGARVSAWRWFGRNTLRLSYEVTEHEQEDFFGAQGSLLHQAVRAGLDAALGRDWSLSVDATSRFGDEQDSLGLGIHLQRRF